MNDVIKENILLDPDFQVSAKETYTRVGASHTGWENGGNTPLNADNLNKSDEALYYLLGEDIPVNGVPDTTRQGYIQEIISALKYLDTNSTKVKTVDGVSTFVIGETEDVVVLDCGDIKDDSKDINS